MNDFELKLSDGSVATWSGSSGKDAAQRYADAHPDCVVVAWRKPRWALAIGMQNIIETPPAYRTGYKGKP